MRTRLFAVVAVAAAAAAGAAAIAFAGGDPLVTCDQNAGGAVGCTSFTVDWTNGPQEALQFEVNKVVGDVVITGLGGPGAREPFEIYAFNWGEETTIAGVPGGGGGGGIGRTEFQALSFVKAIDALTPLFAEHCATGRTFPAVVVEVPASHGTMTYELENAICVLDKHTATGERSDFPIETVSFGYAQITWIFDPKKGDDVRGCYDLARSRTC